MKTKGDHLHEMPKPTVWETIIRQIYRQPYLLRHSIQRQNSSWWQFDCHETFPKMVTISHKLCKNIVFNALKKLMFSIFVRIASVRRFQQISKTYVLWGNKNKTRPFLHINLLVKYSVQQPIHFNGNTFGNKCCRCNEGSLYSIV